MTYDIAPDGRTATQILIYFLLHGLWAPPPALLFLPAACAPSPPFSVRVAYPRPCPSPAVVDLEAFSLRVDCLLPQNNPEKLRRTGLPSIALFLTPRNPPAVPPFRPTIPSGAQHLPPHGWLSPDLSGEVSVPSLQVGCVGAPAENDSLRSAFPLSHSCVENLRATLSIEQLRAGHFAGLSPQLTNLVLVLLVQNRSIWPPFESKFICVLPVYPASGDALSPLREKPPKQTDGASIVFLRSQTTVRRLEIHREPLRQTWRHLSISKSLKRSGYIVPVILEGLLLTSLEVHVSLQLSEDVRASVLVCVGSVPNLLQQDNRERSDSRSNARFLNGCCVWSLEQKLT
ncbi:hypothetical protein BO71DRAFT_428222 [Aspergillus ellipticus CBS 707.79]|uniref:Uncharacterized protein n=1 Tax=Aspergillus ellipticus CBS 707.79 TaxID=1448320 RepID=A0A319DGG9_9EURO|nr:hypothetical protein BO71DRAFT_428222 [Aspergillus ellipticus CBS 707.79]